MLLMLGPYPGILLIRRTGTQFSQNGAQYKLWYPHGIPQSRVYIDTRLRLVRIVSGLHMKAKYPISKANQISIDRTPYCTTR